MAQITDIKLYKGVPMTPENRIQLDYDNIANRDVFFSNYLYKSIIEATYQRENNVIKIEAFIDDLAGVNYVRYVNRNRVYFAYVTNLTYINDDITHLTIVTDPFQTYYGEYDIPSARISRQHKDRFIKQDNIIIPVVDKVTEPIDLSGYTRRFNVTELVSQAEDKYIAQTGNKTPLWVIVSSTEALETPKMPNKSLNGVYYYLFYFDTESQDLPEHKQRVVVLVNNLLGYAYNINYFEPNIKKSYLDMLSHNDKILSINIVPFLPSQPNSVAIEYNQELVTYRINTDGWKLDQSYYTEESTIPLARLDIFPKIYNRDSNTITTINKIDYNDIFDSANLNLKNYYLQGETIPDIEPKLLHSKYTKVEIDDNYSTKLEIKMEEVENIYNDLYLDFFYNVNMDSTYSYELRGYKGQNNQDEIDTYTPTNKMIQFDLRTDNYLNYKRNQQAQNVTTDVVGYVTSAISIIGGIIATATGVGSGLGGFAIAGGVAGLTGQIAKSSVREDAMSKLPDSKRLTGNEIGLVARHRVGKPNLVTTMVGTQQERDNLVYIFKRYGYSDNAMVGYPTFNSRNRFNYIEMSDIIITGDIPNTAKDTIAAAYSLGVTWFHIKRYDEKVDIDFIKPNMEVFINE